MLDGSSIAAVRPRKTAELVANRIRNGIIRGELASGNNLPAEAQLIASFEVSRPTIREAIRILESEGLISVSRGARGGARINRPSADFVARTLGLTLQANRTTLGDIYTARAVIEPPAARLAAETRAAEAAPVLRAHLEEEFERIGDRSRTAWAVSKFHRLLVEQSGNHTLALLVAALHGISEKHLSMVHRSHDNEEATAAQLKRTKAGFRSQMKLVNLIEAGDGAGAETHWASHMRAASEYWLRGFGEKGLDILE